MKLVKVRRAEQVSLCLGFLEQSACCNLYLYEGVCSGITRYQNHCIMKDEDILGLVHTKTGSSVHLFFSLFLDDETVFRLLRAVLRRFGGARSLFGDRDCIRRLLPVKDISVRSFREYRFMETDAERFDPGGHRRRTKASRAVVPPKSDAVILVPLQQAYEIEEMKISPSLLDPVKIQAALVRRISRGEITALYEEEKPVAIAGVNARYGDACQVGSVYVLPEKRGKGYGRELVSAHVSRLLGAYKKVALFVNTENRIACGLYGSLRFTERGMLAQAEIGGG